MNELSTWLVFSSLALSAILVAAILIVLLRKRRQQTPRVQHHARTRLAVILAVAGLGLAFLFKGLADVGWAAVAVPVILFAALLAIADGR